MRTVLLAASCLALLSMANPSRAAEVKHCVKLVAAVEGSARLTNVCSDRLNLSYCVDHPGSGKSCAKSPVGITTLMPGAAEAIPGYAGEGAGAVYWAVCAYPEAPINWKPGPDSAFTCKKTCVMC